jgi:AraC-like DNA-binding protein
MLGVYQEYLLEHVWAELGLSELLFQPLETIQGDPHWKVGSGARSVAAAVEVLHAQATGGVRLADVTADLGKDPAYLARAFRKQMGCTMSQFRRRLMVGQAAHLLASTDTPLAHVAVGVADQSHLCRVFKAHLGMTPQAYRILAGSR